MGFEFGEADNDQVSFPLTSDALISADNATDMG